LAEGLNELSLVSVSGFKSKHDDFIDTVSMLSSMKAWKPSEETTLVSHSGHSNMWDIEEDVVENPRIGSYIV
jgi:hypothetical protein